MQEKTIKEIRKLLDVFEESEKTLSKEELKQMASEKIGEIKADLLVEIIFNPEENYLEHLYQHLENKFHEEIKDGVQSSILRYVEKHFPSNMLFNTKDYLKRYQQRIEKLEDSIQELATQQKGTKADNDLQEVHQELTFLRKQIKVLREEKAQKHQELESELENTHHKVFDEVHQLRMELQKVKLSQNQMTDDLKHYINDRIQDWKQQSQLEEKKNVSTPAFSSKEVNPEGEENEYEDYLQKYSDEKLNAPTQPSSSASESSTQEPSTTPVSKEEETPHFSGEHVQTVMSDDYYIQVQGGEFFEWVKNDKSIRHLYRLTRLDEEEAIFEIINHPVKLHIANQNIEEVILPFAEVLNGTDNPTTKVEVIEKGKAKMVNNKWTVTQKCKFEYR